MVTVSPLPFTLPLLHSPTPDSQSHSSLINRNFVSRPWIRRRWLLPPGPALPGATPGPSPGGWAGPPQCTNPTPTIPLTASWSLRPLQPLFPFSVWQMRCRRRTPGSPISVRTDDALPLSHFHCTLLLIKSHNSGSTSDNLIKYGTVICGALTGIWCSVIFIEVVLVVVSELSWYNETVVAVNLIQSNESMGRVALYLVPFFFLVFFPFIYTCRSRSNVITLDVGLPLLTLIE